MPARNRMDAAVFGENVTYHPVGDIPLSSARGAGTPDEQVRQHIEGLFREGHAGKPHLLPRANELLRQFKEHLRSGAKVEPPKPQEPNPEFRR